MPFDPNAADDQVSGDGAPFDPNAADDQVSGDGAPFDPNATGDQASNDGVPFDPNAADDQASSNDLHQGANDVHPPSSPPLVRHPPVHRPPPRTRVIPAPRFSKVVLLNRRGAVQLRFHSVRGAQKYQARLVSPRRQAFWRRDLKTPVVTFGPRLSQQLKRRFPRQPGRISLRAMVGGQWGRWSSTKTFVFPKAIAKRRVSPRPIHTSRPRVGNRSGNPRVSPRRPRQASALQPYRFAAYLVVLSQGRGEPGKTSEYKGYVFAALCSGGKQITPTVRVMRRKDKTWEAKTRARSRTKGATWRLSNQQFSSGRVAVWGSITEKDTGKNTTLRGPATRFAQACQAGGTASNRKGRATFSARAGDRIQLNWHLNPAKR